MIDSHSLTRRDALKSAGAMGAVGALALAGTNALAAEPAMKTIRIGVVSAAIGGKPQPRNGHIWHFAQGLHPVCDLDALKKHYPYGHRLFSNYLRNPKFNFDQLPFPDTRITHYYDADPKVPIPFTEVFPGVKATSNLTEMLQEVDAVWMGDASGLGDDHFDLVAPGLAKGLPTFCDKPIGGTVAGTRKILEFARKHRTPLMSSSCWRYEWGMEAALRMRDSGDFAQLGDVFSTAVLPTLAEGASAWNPARELKFDVTRQLRAIVNGAAKFHGFALRVVPDRSVDDGWTVRVQLPSQPKVYLEIDSYTDAPAIKSGK